MTACTLTRLLEEASTRGAGGRSSTGSATQKMLLSVWEVVDRYVAACLEHKRGVVLPNFCRIGWQVVTLRGRTTHRPYFQLLDSFCRSYNAKSGWTGATTDGDICTMEEFNFSKAAIKFSSQLTKDHVFTGLRAIIQQIGSVVGQGRPMSLEWSFGKLSAQDHDVQLTFDQELYQAHGLEEFAGDPTRQIPQRPSAPTTGEVQSLTLQGLGARQRASSERTTTPQEASVRIHESASSTRGCSPCALVPASARSRLQEHARDDAVNRKISELELQASEAMRDQAERESQVFVARMQDDRKHAALQAQKREHAAFLQRQIAAKQDKKRTEAIEFGDAAAQEAAPRLDRLDLAPLQKRDILTSTMKEACADQLAAIAHESAQQHPGRLTSHPPRLPQESAGHVTPRPNALKQALDQQVQAKREKKQALHDFERRLDANLVEVRSKEAATRKDMEQALRAQERDSLTAAWREESKMKEVKRSIEALGSGRRLPLQSRAGCAFAGAGRGVLSPSSAPLSARGMALTTAASMALASPRAVEAS